MLTQPEPVRVASKKNTGIDNQYGIGIVVIGVVQQYHWKKNWNWNWKFSKKTMVVTTMLFNKWSINETNFLSSNLYDSATTLSLIKSQVSIWFKRIILRKHYTITSTSLIHATLLFSSVIYRCCHEILKSLHKKTNIHHADFHHFNGIMATSFWLMYKLLTQL